MLATKETGNKCVRKRELADNVNRTIKKARIEKDGFMKNQDIRGRKRKIGLVLNDLLNRVENNDRQLSGTIIRELRNDHIPMLNDSEFPEVSSKLLKSIVNSKSDSITLKIAQLLLSALTNVSSSCFVSFIYNLNDVADSCFSKTGLEGDLFEIYSHALDNGMVHLKNIPEIVTISAKTVINAAIGYSSFSRRKAFKFIVSLCLKNKGSYETWAYYEKVLCESVDDYDPRTRTACMEGLTRLAMQNHNFQLESYFVVKKMLKDSEKNIRIMALRLTLYFANTKSTETVEKDGNVTIADDAFSAVCDGMNDNELQVRVEAAKQLGEFKRVTEDLIFQTLDKNMMRSINASEVVRVESSMFSISKNSSSAENRWRFSKKAQKPEQNDTKGGWSRGKELNAKCPTDASGSVEEEETDSIIPHGACGAFVTALEDEFMDVRKAAVFSLGKLAEQRPNFAVAALEYLADMFNDEIADVRLDAIKALTLLISHGQLNIEQLNVILKCLDDAMVESRQAMRELLKKAQIVDIHGLELCVKALVACLKRFPKDKEQIYSCMAALGRNHSIHVQSIMRSLLGIHLVFQTREHSLEDEKYLAKLILVLNAASVQPSMVSMFPEFVKRHYRFLRTSSNLISNIKILDDEKDGKIRLIEKNIDKAHGIVLNTYNRLCESEETNSFADRNAQRDSIFRDASAISTYNENVNGASRLICSLCEISVAIDNITETILFGGGNENIKGIISQHVSEIESIEYQFSNISYAVLCYLNHCKLYLKMVETVIWILEKVPPQSEISAYGISILDSISSVIKNYTRDKKSIENVIKELRQMFEQPILAVDETKKCIITAADLINLLTKNVPKLPKKFPPIRKVAVKHANIITPNKDVAIESTLRFISNMPHGIQFEARLYNLSADDYENLRLKIIFPGGKWDMMKPRMNEIKKIDGVDFLSTYVKVTSGCSWSDAAEIDIVIGLNTTTRSFVPLYASPSVTANAHVHVKIHPVSRV